MKPFIRGSLIIVAAVIALVAIAAVVMTQFAAPALIRSELEEGFQKNCDGCTLEIAEIETPLTSLGRVIFKDVHVKTGKPGATEIEARTERIVIDFALRDLSQHSVRIKEVTVSAPHVTYTDGDAKVVEKKSVAKSKPFFWTVEKTQLTSGRFLYVRDTHGTHAKLQLHSIAIDISEVSNSKEAQEKTVESQIVMQIEKSGTVDLALKLKPFLESLHMDVDFRVRDQNLSDLTPFLKANAAVEIEGLMKRGRARIRVRGDEETARVWASYSGLKVKVGELYDRTPFVAWALTAGSELTMDDDNSDKDAEDKQRSVVYKREPGQSIVGFLVQGMKEAAIKVAQAN